jgi:DNA gyrase/topoisomerase IV subunit A
MDNNTLKETLKIFSDLSRVYSIGQLEALTRFNYINYQKDINELREENDDLEDIISSQNQEIGELQDELRIIKQNSLPYAENLYDLQKMEIIKELYDNCSLIELERIRDFIK